MKCPNCGAELSFDRDRFICGYCDATFLREELLMSPSSNTEFRIVGGVLTAYCGNQSVVTIPYGIITIGNGAFKNNLAVKRVIFSDTVISIGASAFEGCVNLEEISEYANVAEYGDECFKFSGLSEVKIGRNVHFLGRGCFFGMQKLQKVTYAPGRNIHQKQTFAHCSALTDVEEDNHYFFPSLHSSLELQNNPNNQRPTWGDVFLGTPYLKIVSSKFMTVYKQGICPECGGKLIKTIFHAKCQNCGIDHKN